MADKSLIEQMLERLVNDDQAKAEELFHEYVVAKSREIYESLIDSEIDEAAEEDDEDEEMDEAAKADKEEEDEDLDEAAASEEDDEDEDMDENFDEVAIEGDDEMDLEKGDPTDDLAGELGGEEGEQSEEEIMQDLGSIIDELQAKFDALTGSEEEQGEFDMGGEEGGEEDEMKDALEPELATVREYVEKVAPAKMGDDGANTKSIVAGKNDMGGTTANIVKGGESTKGGTQGGLLNPSPKEDNAGNINVPGGNAGKTGFKKKEPGHGAEKKGTGDNGANTTSLFRGRR